MSERFNFYDIYGYLLPGGLLLALLWPPFGLLFGQWPPADWGSAILGLGLAYIAGHLLHALSEGAFPSEFRDRTGRRRHPSDLLVDTKDEKALPSTYRLGSMKQQLATQIERRFDIKIDIEAPWTPQLAARRRDAFFKCRRFLIKKKAAAYAEQSQGMYALMRGSAAAFFFACALYLGLGFGASPYCLSPINAALGILLLPLAIAFVVAFHSICPRNAITLRWHKCVKTVSRQSQVTYRWVSHLIWRLTQQGMWRRVLCAVFISPWWLGKRCLRWLVWPRDERTTRQREFWFLIAAMVCAGLTAGRIGKIVAPTEAEFISRFESGLRNEDDPVKFREKERTLLHLRQANWICEQRTGLMFTLALTAAVLGLVCLSAFRAFAANYASTIYRDFSALAPPPAEKDTRAQAPNPRTRKRD